MNVIRAAALLVLALIGLIIIIIGLFTGPAAPNGVELLGTALIVFSGYQFMKAAVAVEPQA